MTIDKDAFFEDEVYADGDDIVEYDITTSPRDLTPANIVDMIDFAFNGENVDILHCFCEDYNIHSRRMWEKHGFTLVLTEELPQPQKGKYQYHYRLTNEEYQNNIPMGLLTDKWCNLSENATIFIVTDSEQALLAEDLKSTMTIPCEIILWEETCDLSRKMQALAPCDLVVALFSFDTFVKKGANNYFSPFQKPEGIAAKYVFIRLGISKRSLLQGLKTPKELMYSKIKELSAFEAGSKLHVSNALGTDVTLVINGFAGCENEITSDGGMAFLPPSEVSAEVKSFNANGKIVVDITVGQLYLYGEFLGEFGLVDSPSLCQNTVWNSPTPS